MIHFMTVLYTRWRFGSFFVRSPFNIFSKAKSSLTVASPDGGVDIEEVAEKTPERIKKLPVDIKTGLTDDKANEVAEFLGFSGELKTQCAEQIKRLYTMFLKVCFNFSTFFYRNLVKILFYMCSLKVS